MGFFLLREQELLRLELRLELLLHELELGALGLFLRGDLSRGGAELRRSLRGRQSAVGRGDGRDGAAGTALAENWHGRG